MSGNTDDRRAALEAAFEASEKPNENNQGSETLEQAEIPKETIEETPKETTATETTEQLEATEQPPKETATDKPEAEGEVVPEVTDAAPAAWKPGAKSKWATVDPEVRQEVQRREREVTKVLTDTASARQIAARITEIVTPYQARFKSMNINPLEAVNNLLQADYQLSNGTKHQRAQLVARLIKDYDVDIASLDEVLSGQVTPTAQAESQFRELLQKELAPVQQRLQTYEQREQEAQRLAEEAFNRELAALSTNKKDFPHFEQVREAMADLIEISARRGVPLELKTAYNRAVAADPEISAQMESARQAAQLKQAALQAQRAKAASSSVNGAPSGAVTRLSEAPDRRATIAAAFDSLGG